MRWIVNVLVLVIGFALGALCMDLLALRAMRGYLTGYLMEQGVREDAKATAAACNGDAVEEAMRRWSAVAFSLDNARAYEARHTTLKEPFLAAMADKLSETTKANAMSMGDLYRAKLIDALKRADRAALAEEVRRHFAGRKDLNLAEVEEIGARLAASDCGAENSK
ncbi:MAG TPA: hypothetical protein VI299_26605 [Polyangiales bacterium]